MGALIKLYYYILKIAADCYYIIVKYDYITRKLLKCLGTLTSS